MPNFRTYYIGIDVGKHGAIAVQNNADNTVITHVMPLITSGVYDFVQINEILSFYSTQKCHVVFEDLRAIYGTAANSTFELGFGAGLTEAFCVANGLPFTKIAAKVWQNEMFVGVREITKKAANKKGFKRDTKAMALVACKRLHPKQSLTNPLSKKATVPHDGIVDALLLSDYCKKHFK